MNAKDYADPQGRDLSKLGRHRLELHLRVLAPNASHPEPVKSKPVYRAANAWGKPVEYRKPKPQMTRYGRTADAGVLQRLYPDHYTFAMLAEALGIQAERVATHRLEGRYGLEAIVVPPKTPGMGRTKYVVTKEAAAAYVAKYKESHRV